VESVAGSWRHLGCASVRRAEGDQCGRCNAYIIAKGNTRIGQTLTTVFPACQVVAWEPVARELQGKPKLAIEYIDAWLRQHPGEVLRFTAVQKEIGIVHSPQFTQSIQQHEGFREALEELGIEECGGLKRKSGFRRMPEEAADH
jgi:hypothetical protein